MGGQWLRLCIAAVFALLALPGHAHAVLLDSSPKPGEMLMRPPTEVVANFNEGVGPIFFKVLDDKGREVGKPAQIRLDGTKMILPLDDTLPNGTYVLTYRVISADTHPVGATFGFSVGEPMKTIDTQGEAGARSPWAVAVTLNRWMLYAGMLWASGAAIFLLLLGISGALRTEVAAKARGAAVITLVTYVLAIGLGGADMQLGGLDALWSAAAWRSGLDSTLTGSAVLGVLAMLLLWSCFRAGADWRPDVLMIGAALAIGSFLVTGHAATAPPAWLMAPIVALHLAATAFWLAALWPLQRSVSLLPAVESGRLMQRFSVFAVPAVTVVLMSGVAISLKQLGSPTRLFDNDYGSVLLAKVSLVLVIILIAVYNKKVLTPRLIEARDDAACSIRRTIRLELLLYVLVLGAASALTITTPPRALVAAGSEVGTATMATVPGGLIKQTLVSASGHSAEIELSPAKVGENMLMATIKDPAGNIILTAAALEVGVSLESAGIDDVRVKAEPVGNGMWHAMVGATLIPGDWVMTIDCYVTDYDKVSFTTTVALQ
jgi:copper transport protein